MSSGGLDGIEFTIKNDQLKLIENSWSRGEKISFGFCDIGSVIDTNAASNLQLLEIASYIKFGIQIEYVTPRRKIEIVMNKDGTTDPAYPISFKDDIGNNDIKIKLVKGKSYDKNRIDESGINNIVRWRIITKIGNANWKEHGPPSWVVSTTLEHKDVALGLACEKKNIEPVEYREELKILNLFSNIKGIKYYHDEGNNYRYETVSLIKG